ncbi:MAG: hypothetical protein J6X94_03440 [Lachnospiraceae bacterium]|nr:hypothetical protein [Lachnospiraceae bacterium]
MKPLLAEYQWDAVERLDSGKILYGGVGSGKSRTSLAYYFCKECGGIIDGFWHGEDVNFREMTNPKDLYIITTARKRDTADWELEMVPFLLGFGNGPKVTVDSWNNIKKYTETEGAFFIFDEQRVIGSGQWVKAFLKIAKKNRWILASATPGDSWADYIPVFIANGFYKNRTEFKAEHMLITYHRNIPIVTGYTGIGKLRRLRDSVLVGMDYDKVNVRYNEVRMCDYDSAKYKDIIKRRWNDEEDRPILSISEYYSLLKKVVNSDPSRGEMVLEILKDNPRLLIFYNYNYEREILRNLPYPEGTVIAEWNGDKHEIVPTGDKWVYLVQYSCTEGWNCKETDSCVFYSQNYSYRVMEQAAGRIDRMDSPYRNLYYYHLRSNAPIDIRIARCIRQKKTFNERSDFQQSGMKNFNT